TQGEGRRTKSRGNGEGSIYFDGRMYRAAVTIDGGKRKYLSGKTRAEVAKKLNAAIDARDKGLPLAGLRLSTAELLDYWLEHNVKPSQKPLTYEKYAFEIRKRIKPAVGKVPLARLGPEHVQKIQAQMAAAGLSVATINGMRTTLSAALTNAEKWGKV